MNHPIIQKISEKILSIASLYLGEEFSENVHMEFGTSYTLKSFLEN